MTITLFIMHAFKHAQPALLYLVPGVLGAVWLTAVVRGEVKEMWEYSEAVDGSTVEEHGEGERRKEQGEAEGTDGQGGKESKDGRKGEESDRANLTWSQWFGASFFSTRSSERNARRLEKSLGSEGDKSDAPQESQGAKEKARPTDDGRSKKSARAMEKDRSTNERSGALFSFSITAARSRRRSSRSLPEDKTEPRRSTRLSQAMRQANDDDDDEEKSEQNEDKVIEETDDDVVLVSDADIRPSKEQELGQGEKKHVGGSKTTQTPRWRGSNASRTSREEEVQGGGRAGKRLRTS